MTKSLLIAGRIDLMFDGGVSSLPHVKEGRLRVQGEFALLRILGEFKDLTYGAGQGQGIPV